MSNNDLPCKDCGGQHHPVECLMDTKSNLEKYQTDVFGEFAIWVWGKDIPKEVFECQKFMRESPLGEYIQQLESQVKFLEERYASLGQKTIYD